jgi:hypothetical protein
VSREHVREQVDGGPVGAARDRSNDAPSEQVLRLLQVLLAGPGSTKSLMRALELAHRPSFLYRYLQPALRAGWVEMTDPDHPKSPRQRYRLATAGRRVLADSRGADGAAPPVGAADPTSGSG